MTETPQPPLIHHELRQVHAHGGSKTIVIPSNIRIFKEGDWANFKPIGDNKVLLTKIHILEEDLIP